MVFFQNIQNHYFQYLQLIFYYGTVLLLYFVINIKYLKKKNFPYKTPEPILNSKGQELFHINGKNLWVYKKINGEILENGCSLNQYRQIAKALALFHKYTEKFQ